MRRRTLRGEEAVSAEVAEAAEAGERMLSARQRQILEMLRAGKVNKEIASELGIGLGTVKQHVVALFKKLNVRNRAMAVSRGLELSPQAKPQLLDEGLLESRPCVVVSLMLSSAAPEGIGPVGRLLQQTMAAIAYDCDAIFLARKLHAGDLIFGIQQSGETLMAQALHAAHRVAETLADPCHRHGAALRGGMVAGMAVASMERQGGWSGEAIASAAIAQSRQLAEGAGAGSLALDASARDLLLTLGPSSQNLAVAESFRFEELDRAPWRQPAGGVPAAPSLPGREAETARIDAWLEGVRRGDGRTVYIEGEIGMGKSALADYAAARGGGLAMRVHRLLCLGAMGEHALFALADGVPLPLADALARLRASATTPEIWIVDDCHLLPPAASGALLREAGRARGRLILLCGRRQPDVASRVDEILHLGRLSPAAVRKIVQRRLGAAPDGHEERELVEQATGVPLFVMELARHGASRMLPLSLRLVIGARMDRLKLDRLLLRHVACDPGAWSEVQLVRIMREPRKVMRAGLDRAVASGVLVQDDQGRYRYAHPLLRQAVIQAKVE